MDWKMISLVVTVCVAIVIAAPQQPQQPVAIVSQQSELNPDGSYSYSFETANGIKTQETGTPKKATQQGAEDSLAVQGSVSYKDLEGNEISLTYTADDENGFQPVGAHLPTPPPIPPEIQRALEWNAAHPEEDSKKP